MGWVYKTEVRYSPGGQKYTVQVKVWVDTSAKSEAAEIKAARDKAAKAKAAAQKAAARKKKAVETAAQAAVRRRAEDLAEKNKLQSAAKKKAAQKRMFALLGARAAAIRGSLAPPTQGSSKYVPPLITGSVPKPGAVSPYGGFSQEYSQAVQKQLAEGKRLRDLQQTQMGLNMRYGQQEAQFAEATKKDAVGTDTAGKILEGLIADSRKNQLATGGKGMNRDFVEKVMTAYNEHIAKVRADAERQGKKLDGLLVKKKGQWYWADADAQKRGKNIMDSSAYKGAMAEWTRLMGEEGHGAAWDAMNAYKQMGDDQRIWIRDTARAAFLKGTDALKRRDKEDRAEAAAREEEWNTSEKWLYEASMDDIDPLKTSMVWEYDKELGMSKARHRTVQEEFDFRKSEYIAQAKREYNKQYNNFIASQARNARMEPGEGTRNIGWGGRDAVRNDIATSMKDLGYSEDEVPRSRKEQIAIVDAAMVKWEKDNAHWWQNAKGKTGLGIVNGITGANVMKWQKAKDAQRKRYYDAFHAEGFGLGDFLETGIGELGKTTYGQGFGAVVGGAVDIFSGIGGVITAGARATALMTTGNSTIEFPLRVSDLPDKVQKEWLKIGSAPRFAKGAQNPVEGFQEAWDMMVAHGGSQRAEDYVQHWLNETEEGKRWVRDYYFQKGQKSKEEDAAFMEAVYGKGGDIFTRMKAVGEYGMNVTSDPAFNLALNLGLDPSVAMPMKFTTWGARLAHALSVTKGMPKYERLAKGFVEFQRINESELRFSKGMKPFMERLAAGESKEAIKQDLLAELAGILERSADDKAAQKKLRDWGIEPKLVNGKVVMSDVQQQLIKAFDEAGIDYVDIAKGAVEAENVARAEAKLLKDEISEGARIADEAAKAADQKAYAKDAAKRDAKILEKQTAIDVARATAKDVLQTETDEILARRAAAETSTVVESSGILQRVVQEPLRAAARKANAWSSRPRMARTDDVAYRPDPDQETADLMHVLTNASDSVQHLGHLFSPGKYFEDFKSSALGAELRAILGPLDETDVKGMAIGVPQLSASRGSVPDPTVFSEARLRMTHAERVAWAEEQVFNHARESQYVRMRKEQSVGRSQGPLDETGMVPFKEAKNGSAYQVAGGKTSANQAINTPTQQAMLAGVDESEVLTHLGIERALEKAAREITSVGAALKAGRITQAQFDLVMDTKFRTLGVQRIGNDLSTDVRSTHGDLIYAELDHILYHKVEGFIPMGNIMVEEYLATGTLGRFYEALSLLPGAMTGPGLQTELMANIKNPVWRANLSRSDFANMLRRHIFLSPNPSPQEFRDGMAHLFALFHLTKLDGEQAFADIRRIQADWKAQRIVTADGRPDVLAYQRMVDEAFARGNGSEHLLKEYSKTIANMLATDAQKNNVYFRGWQVLESRTGMPWVTDTMTGMVQHAEAEHAFLRSVVETGQKTVQGTYEGKLHPNLALGMLSPGPIARVQPITHGYTGHLRTLASSTNRLVRMSFGYWNDKDIVAILTRMAKGEMVDVDEAMRAATQISHYYASRYGSTGRRAQYGLVSRDFAIEATYAARTVSAQAELEYKNLRTMYVNEMLPSYQSRRADLDDPGVFEGDERAVAKLEAEFDGFFTNKPELVPMGGKQKAKDLVKKRKDFPDVVRRLYDEAYWRGEISHQNAGLHANMFLAKMADPTIQRGDEWVRYANAFYDHMTFAGAQSQAKELLGVIFEPLVYRTVNMDFEEATHLAESAGPLPGVWYGAVREFFIKIGSTGDMERAIAAGKIRMRSEMSFADRVVEEEMMRNDFILADDYARATSDLHELGVTKMYSMASVENVMSSVTKHADVAVKAGDDLRRLEHGEKAMESALRAYDDLDRAVDDAFANARNEALRLDRAEARKAVNQGKKPRNVGNRYYKAEMRDVVQPLREARDKAADVAEAMAHKLAAENKAIERLDEALAAQKKMQDELVVRAEDIAGTEAQKKALQAAARDVEDADKALKALKADPDSPSRLVNQPIPRPSNPEMKAYHANYKKIRWGKLNPKNAADKKLLAQLPTLEDANKKAETWLRVFAVVDPMHPKVLWARQVLGDPAFYETGEGRALYYLQSLPDDARPWVVSEIRERNARKGMLDGLNNIITRTAKTGSMTNLAGEELAEMVKIIKATPGGPRVLARWSKAYYAELLNSRLIDYVKHEDWFTYVDEANARQADRLLADAESTAARLTKQLDQTPEGPTKVALQKALAGADEAVAVAKERVEFATKNARFEEIKNLLGKGEKARKMVNGKVTTTAVEPLADDVVKALWKERRELGKELSAYWHRYRQRVGATRRTPHIGTGMYSPPKRVFAEETADTVMLAAKVNEITKATERVLKIGETLRNGYYDTSKSGGYHVPLSAEDITKLKNERRDLEAAIPRLSDERDAIVAQMPAGAPGQQRVVPPTPEEITARGPRESRPGELDYDERGLPYDPTAEALRSPKVHSAQEALRILEQMTEEEWLNSELAEAIVKRRASRGAKRRDWGKRIDDLNAAKRVVDYSNKGTGGRYTTPKSRKNFAKGVIAQVGERAKGSIAPKMIAAFVFHAEGAEIEQGRSLYRLLKLAGVDLEMASRLRKPGEVSQSYLMHGDAIETRMGQAIPKHYLQKFGIHTTEEVTATMMLTELDEFGDVVNNKEFQNFIVDLSKSVTNGLREETGNLDYTIKDWLDDRLVHARDGYLDSRLYEEADRRIVAVKEAITDGAHRQSRTDLRKAAGDSPFTPMAEMVETDINVVIAKAKVLAEMGIDPHAYNEARRVLRPAYMRKKAALNIVGIAAKHASDTLYAAGHSVNDANWTTLYDKAYKDAYLAQREIMSDKEAISLIDELAKGEMYGASNIEIIEEFERRYGLDQEVRGFEPQSITPFQKRTLEEAVKTHLGIDDLNDPAQVIAGLSKHQQAPPFNNREAMRDWLTEYGFWSPRTAQAIEAGKKSWSIQEEGKFYQSSWGRTPDWANAELLREGGSLRHILFDMNARADQYRTWGLFNRNMEARFATGNMSRLERARFLVEGSPELNVNPVRDIATEKAYVLDRYGDLVTDSAGNLIAFPELMNRAELEEFLVNSHKQGIVLPEGQLNDIEEARIMWQLTDKHVRRQVQSMLDGKTQTFADTYEMSARIVAEMLENPIWTKRTRDHLGKVIRGQAQFRRSLVFTQLAFLMQNVVDTQIKGPWTGFITRSFRHPVGLPIEIRERGNGYGLKEFGFKPSGQLLRDEPLHGSHRFGALRKGMKEGKIRYYETNGVVREETALEKAIADRVQYALAISELPAQGASMAEDATKLRLARSIYGGAYQRAMKKLGDDGLADAYARKFAHDEVSRLWPTVGDGPIEGLFNQFSPFLSYQFKNRTVFLGEMASHPALFNYFNTIGDAVEQANLEHWKETHGEHEEMPENLRRLIQLPWAPDLFIDFGAWSDAQHALKPLYDVVNGKATVGSLASQFVRLASANDINIVLGIMNALDFGKRMEWQQGKDANGFPNGIWSKVEVPWEAPWGGEAKWQNSFWPVEWMERAESALEGGFTAKALTQIAYQTAFFGGMRAYDRGMGLNSYFWTLKEADAEAAKAFLDTVDGKALQMWWADKLAKTHEFYTPQSVRDILNPPKMDRNPWLHTQTQDYQKKVQQGYEDLDNMRLKWDNVIWKLKPGTPEFSNALKQRSIERNKYYLDHPWMIESQMHNMSPAEWARQLDNWQVDDLVDSFFNIERPKRANYPSQEAYDAAVKVFERQRKVMLDANPKLVERLAGDKNAVEQAWEDIETHWFDDVMTRIGTRKVAIEAAKQAEDFDMLDQLYLANDLDYKLLGEETSVQYFDPTTDFNTLPKAGYKEMQGPASMRTDPAGNPLLKRMQIFDDFDSWRFNRMNIEEQAKYKRDKRYAAGMKEVVRKAKAGGGFDGAAFVRELKKDPWLLNQYFANNKGKREEWAATDEYIRRISRYGILAKQGRFDEAGRYFDSLPAWVKARYFKKHGDKRGKIQQNLEYINWMKRWTSHYRKRDYAGGADFFAKMPKWVRDRYYQKHPDGFGRGAAKSTPYSKAMGTWVGLLKDNKDAEAKKFFDSMPQAFRDRYYSTHPEQKLRDDVKRTGQLAEYFSADDANRAAYLRENPEFAKWLAKQSTKDNTRRMLIMAGYQALPKDNQWLKRVYREKYPEVFSKEAAGVRALDKVTAFLAKHPEMNDEYKEWLSAVMVSYEESLKHHKAQPKPLEVIHQRQHGMNRKRPHSGKSAAWVRLHSLS